MLTLKEMVSGGKKVRFSFYRKDELWYATEDGFQFPVPTKDTGDGTFLPEDKAMMFMRYIRKQLEEVAKEQPIEIDMERMKTAMASPRYEVPPGLDKEGIRNFILGVAAKTKAE